MLRSEKTTRVDDIRARFNRMTSAVFVDYQGMTVAEVSQLRDVFRERGVEYKVVKNTLVRQALIHEPWVQKLGVALKGMTGIAWSFEEPSAAAKVIKDFRKENKKLKVKAGVLEGLVLGPDAVESQLASMPSKDEARAMLLATFNAAAQRMVMLLNTPARNLVGVLEAKRREQAEG
jgi:large subunit ribosomal protein L10